MMLTWFPIIFQINRSLFSHKKIKVNIIKYTLWFLLPRILSLTLTPTHMYTHKHTNTHTRTQNTVIVWVIGWLSKHTVLHILYLLIKSLQSIFYNWLQILLYSCKKGEKNYKSTQPQFQETGLGDIISNICWSADI